MHQWRMWNAVDGLPLCFVAEKDGCGARQPKFSAKRFKVHLQTTIPVLGLTSGGALGS